MSVFVNKWLEAVDKKDSIVCAGLDPADYAIGRSDKGEGLPAGKSKLSWAVDYISAVAPHVAAIKPNIRYWQNAKQNDLESLDIVIQHAKSLGLVVIQDSKEADIGSTNDAGIFYAALRGADAVTIAPFAGNMEESARQGKDRGIGVIAMCLMSNPQYATEKNKLVRLSDDQVSKDEFAREDIQKLGDQYVPQYVHLAHNARKHGLDGIVVGAPSSENHIREYEIERVAHYFGTEGVILVPGIGKQGGEVTILTKFFPTDNLICNVGRGLMFPNGANSTPEEQGAAAKGYKEMLKQLCNK